MLFLSEGYQSALHVLDTGIGNLTASLHAHGMWSNTIFAAHTGRAFSLLPSLARS